MSTGRSWIVHSGSAWKLTTHGVKFDRGKRGTGWKWLDKCLLFFLCLTSDSKAHVFLLAHPVTSFVSNGFTCLEDLLCLSVVYLRVIGSMVSPHLALPDLVPNLPFLLFFFFFFWVYSTSLPHQKISKPS